MEEELKEVVNSKRMENRRRKRTCTVTYGKSGENVLAEKIF